MSARREIVVTMAHVRQAGISDRGVLCATGIRAWAQRHGIDLRRFAAEGMPIEDVERIDDAFAQRAAAIAREEAAREAAACAR